jgi:hypothetical protein
MNKAYSSTVKNVAALNRLLNEEFLLLARFRAIHDQYGITSFGQDI